MRIAIITLLLLTIYLLIKTQKPNLFNQDRAFQDVAYQLSLGPRVVGSPAHAQFIEWATGELDNAGWELQLQTYEWAGEQLTIRAMPAMDKIKNLFSK